MKIGLCLAHKGVNYGMLLQAYATQRAVESMGYETEIIDYTRTDYKHIRLTPFLPFFFIHEINRKRKRKQERTFTDDVHKKNVEARKIVSDRFIEERLINRVKINGIVALENHAQQYNGVLVGSDQLWAPDSAFGNFTTLRFAPDSMNKISYATSLGVSSYPFWCKSSAKNFMKRIEHISVREESGRDIIKGICDVPVQVVLDPTYLLTYEQWLELIPSERLVEGDYVLCYFLGATKEHKLLARAYADKHNKKLVTILSTESISDIDTSFADEVITGYGPEKFINLIRHADVVMTDSFHGLAFSVINKRQFYVFYRTLVGSKGSRNSRIDNILKTWNLRHRLVMNDYHVDDFASQPVDYAEVDKILKAKRTESLDFLRNALEGCK